MGSGQGAGDALYWAWLLVGLVGAVAYSWLGYLLVRRVLGYRMFRGCWYSKPEYRALLQLIFQDSQRGLPLRDDEVKALQAWFKGDPLFGAARSRLNTISGLH